jgi:hypothetical protein
MKLLVKTLGPFGLTDMYTGCQVVWNRPSVVKPSAFVDQRIQLGQIRVISQIPDEATDEEFKRFLIDSGENEELAVSSFLSQFEAHVETPAAKRLPKAALKD